MSKIPILVNENILRKFIDEVLMMAYDHCRIDFLIETSKSEDFKKYLQEYESNLLKERIFKDYCELRNQFEIQYLHNPFPASDQRERSGNFFKHQ